MELGWVAREKALTKDDMLHVSGLIRSATNLITPDEDEAGDGNGKAYNQSRQEGSWDI